MKIDELNVDEHYGEIGEVVSDEQKRRGVLIHAFQKIQKEHNYLPEDQLKELSEKLNIPLSEVYGAASFYKHFYFKPRGKNIVCVCVGTACHVRGASKVLEKLEEEFGVKEGETAPDKSMTLETVGCVGCCGLAPVVTVNEEVVGELTPHKMKEIIEKIKE
ncbi:MAG: NADH-quinone oxidoreductase subunit NuoE [Alphaproteobacteria bacterium]|uniref:NADH-quinone oxidoreductase subunit NuoE n=1 Tax=Candidatus Nitrobium versatile TaxID=2884831 RepID=A0A953JAD9_9BACT|nr:NADH-quinone oxidoreductase subunit NuoE [Candidatus Nitrobium versatile]